MSLVFVEVLDFRKGLELKSILLQIYHYNGHTKTSKSPKVKTNNCHCIYPVPHLVQYIFTSARAYVDNLAFNGEQTDRQRGMEQSLAHLLLIAVVCEAHEGELVAHKGLWYGEGLLLPSILLNVVKVTGVNVTAQFRHYWGSRYTG